MEGKLKNELLNIFTINKEKREKDEENMKKACTELFPIFLSFVKDELKILAKSYEWTALSGIRLDLTKLFNKKFENSDIYSFKSRHTLYINTEQYLINIEKLKVSNIVQEENVILIVKFI